MQTTENNVCIILEIKMAENISIKTDANGSIRFTIDPEADLGDTSTGNRFVARTSYWEKVPNMPGYSFTMTMVYNPKKAAQQTTTEKPAAAKVESTTKRKAESTTSQKEVKPTPKANKKPTPKANKPTANGATKRLGRSLRASA